MESPNLHRAFPVPTVTIPLSLMSYTGYNVRTQQSTDRNCILMTKERTVNPAARSVLKAEGGDPVWKCSPARGGGGHMVAAHCRRMAVHGLDHCHTQSYFLT